MAPTGRQWETPAMQGSLRTALSSIAEGTSLPDSSKITSEPLSPGWRMITNLRGQGLDRHFSQMGWTVFRKATPLSVKRLGFGESQTVLKAFHKIPAGQRISEIRLCGNYQICNKNLSARLLRPDVRSCEEYSETPVTRSESLNPFLLQATVECS